MKITRILLTIILFSLFFSCSNGLLKDPRLYNPKKKSTVTIAPEPELELTGGVDVFDLTDQWYNKPDTNGDESNPDAVDFAASEFDNIQITGWFSDKNVPTYTMTKGNVWTPGKSETREYVHNNAPATEGQGWSITGVTYYQYRGINPGYAADGNYNTALQVTSNNNPKLSRFYFYRFTGKGGGVQWLDNNLIAVDTYSKLVFAFSEPVEFSGMGAPTKWDPTDNEAFYGTTYQFYMYDPVGYVLKKENGSYEIELYQWFQDSLASGNYKANINTSYTEIAKKDKNKPGKSPFNNHVANFFGDNMKLLAGQPFYSRETTADGGNGLVLYTYVINEDGKTITRTAKSWNGLPTETDLQPKTYTISDEGESATKGKITLADGSTVDFELSNESRTMMFGNGEKAVSNFNDPGPAFIERVKHNPTYELGKTKYVFSNNGKTLTMDYVNWLGQDKTATYTYQKQESNTQARYSGYLVELRNSDNEIYSSTVANVAVWSSVMEYRALLKRDADALTTFTDAVKGLEFSYRQSNDNGLDLSLMTLGFSADGKTATLYEIIWGDGTRKETSIKDVEVLDGSSRTSGTIGDKTATLTIPESGSWKLEYDGQTYELGYNDKGPSFVNRVKNNPVYVSEDGKTTYRFSNFGRTMRMTHTGNKILDLIPVGNFDYVYTFVENVDPVDSKTSRAIYGSNDAALYYAGFELSESDMLIKASRTSGAGKDLFAWDMTYDARRDKNTGGLPTEEDLNHFYESMKGKSFYTRSVENGVAGLDLLTWRFEEGRAVKHTKQTWLSNSTVEVITIPSEIQLTAVNRTSGTLLMKDGTRYTFTLNDTADSVLVEKTLASGGTTSNTYYSNYNDQGPGFINRVKGKTYVEAGKTKETGYSYTFSADGKTCYYKNPNAGWLEWDDETLTYYNAEKKEGLYEVSAAYKGPYGGFGSVWGFKLTENDKKLATSSAATSGNDILVSSDTFTDNPAKLVE